MSFEYFISSDRPLPEIKRKGQEILSVGDMIRRNIPDGAVPWKEMNKNAEVLFVSDPVAANRFYIESAPYASKIMESYTELDHIYTFDVSPINFSYELYNYTASLDKDAKLEIWHLWFGYDFEDEVVKRKM